MPVLPPLLPAVLAWMCPCVSLLGDAVDLGIPGVDQSPPVLCVPLFSLLTRAPCATT